ncbi:DNA-binding response regulator [Winogradskyella bathintestinalis]|uniref:Response regulator n=1 Tax=Winogradskyella bathintestinalis TaxID=3035208 RepID=A0ABT7ZT31_9FLAO|nr:response regulator [Winogradskyella bathintestinalis]MDN3491888.1 response regulator [Winogradskyella bathintestinalis]
MLKILLIEDELIIAKDLQLSLQKDEFATIDIARNYDESIALFLEHNYDLVISDINLKNSIDGIAIIEKFSDIKTVPVVYLTAYSDSKIVDRAKSTMPFAYILKPFNLAQLKITINLAFLNFKKHEENIKPSDENRALLETLTKREKEILIILSTGKTSKEIAESLHISSQTVEKHKQNIRSKLSLKTIGELINFTMTSKLFMLSE